ncbi:unnamed protein product [Rotaria socialis]|uniref:Integrase catalytic domain-containing protein n=1 Tax=Rotaria socialis TaxID=392032 RepID=A0A818C609_9BILA|nr:unnamed protein product [Rotaria socialis]
MKRPISQHIQSCLLCQQHNINRSKKPGRLQPISTSEGLFQMIGIDYCGPFKQTPSDREHNNWDEYLLPIIFAYNTGIHATTQYSPYQLQFGREPRLPTDEPSTSFIFNKPIGYYDQLKKSSLIIQRQAHGHIIYRQR